MHRRGKANNNTDKKSDLNRGTLTYINRKDRYLLSIAMISIFFAVFVTAYRMFLKDMNKVYLTNTFDIYIRPEQLFGIVLSTVCISLVIRLICFCYFEAKTLINFGSPTNKDINAIKDKWEQKADYLYESFFLYFKCYTIFLGLFILLSFILFENLKINFIVVIIATMIISCAVSLFFSICNAEIISSSLKSIYREKLVKELAIVIIIVLLAFAISMSEKKEVGSIDLIYSNTKIDIVLESNFTFDEVQVIVKNSDFEKNFSLDVEDEDLYFSSMSFHRNKINDEINKTNGRNIEPEYLNDIQNNFLYYRKSVDYGDFLIEGENRIMVLVSINGTTHKIVNYLEKNEDKYTYLKESYQKDL